MSVIEAPNIEKAQQVLVEGTTAEQKLLNAELYLRVYGWCRGRDIDPATGRVCIVGALIHGNGSSFVGVEDPAYRALNRAVGEYPVCWNDRVCESAGEALAMLRRARELLS